jgi:polyphosphate:AMP phosphotransferase
MLAEMDLSCKIDKPQYKLAKEQHEMKMAALQRQAKDAGIPIIIVFEGWDAAGKGTLINDLILPLDPRGFMVTSTFQPTLEEKLYPFLWRFWKQIPAEGRIVIFDRSWYSHVLNDRVDGNIRGKNLQQAFQDIRSFERQLSDNGYLIIKLFLHISKQEQKKRFNKLKKNPATSWRVTQDDIRRHRQYEKYMAATEDMLSKTDTDFSPWTVVESHDHRFASLKIFNTVIRAVDQKLRVKAPSPVKPGRKKARELDEVLRSSMLEKIDLSRTMEKSVYRNALKKKQKILRELEHEIYTHRIPVMVLYEGWDAAGKGGNIRRLTQTLDPRGYEVVPIAAPNDIEKSHHYLWRFWMQIPKAGHLTIFDRSWYGRVLVERVEEFCTPSDWRRAYREINEMEEHIANFGAVIVKFWIHIDRDEQLRRFKLRQQQEHKRWKITDEDWRNRKKWNQYREAIDEMLMRTSTPLAPWTVVESNCKLYARIKCLDTVIDAIKKRI